MQQQNVPISLLMDMYKRVELRVPEIQRHYVWRATQAEMDALFATVQHRAFRGEL